jgi:hypothetical protein
MQVMKNDSVSLIEYDPETDQLEKYLIENIRTLTERLVAQIAVTVPWSCRSEQGTEMQYNGTLSDLVIRSSICNHPLVISEKLELSVIMPYPVEWNSFRVWDISLVFSKSHLQYLADHISLFSQLGAHWSQGAPVQRKDFVPYDIKIDVQMVDSLDLRFVASPNNSFHVAGKGMGNRLDPGTPLVVLHASKVDVSLLLPLNKFLRRSMDISYNARIESTSLAFAPGRGSMLEAILSNGPHNFVSGASVSLKGLYTYFYEWTPDMRDVFTMDVICDDASIVIQPYYLSALNAVSKNYFGADKRAMAPTVLAQRGGFNEAELEVQQQLRRLKGDCVNQSDSYLTVHLQNTNFLLPHSLLSDKDFATASVLSLVFEMHSSYGRSSFSDMIVECSPTIISFPQSPIECVVASANPQFSENGVGNLVLEGLYFKSSSFFGPKPEFLCYCNSKDVLVSAVYGSLLPLQLQHVVRVYQNLFGDWSYGTDLYATPNNSSTQNQLNSKIIHLKSVNLTILFPPFSCILNALNLTYESSNDCLNYIGPEGVFSAPDLVVRAFLHSSIPQSAAMPSFSPKDQSSFNHKSPEAFSSQRPSSVTAYEMMHLSVPLTFTSTLMRSCVDADAIAKREFWLKQDKESERLRYILNNEECATKSSPRSAASNAASTAGATSVASGRSRRYSRPSHSFNAPTNAPSVFEGISAAASVAPPLDASSNAASSISENAWYALTLETPRGDGTGDKEKLTVVEEDMFDVNDFGSAHSSVSTPNEDDLHSARSLSSDGGGSRIVLNDADIGSSFSTPREDYINDALDDNRVAPLHITATLCWRERLSLCGRTGQSLHHVALSGPIVDPPTVDNSLYFDKEIKSDNQFSSPADSSMQNSAGVGTKIKGSIVESDSTASEFAERTDQEEKSGWDFKSLAAAEFEDGDGRACHNSQVLTFDRGICCRVSAIAPSAIEVILEYLSLVKNEFYGVSEFQLMLPSLNKASAPGMSPTTPVRDSPKLSQTESPRVLISLFEYAHQAVRSASFSSPDAMLLKHTLKKSFLLTIPFVSVDVYPPPPIVPYASLLSSVCRNFPGFALVRFVAGGLKYKVASQTHVRSGLLYLYHACKDKFTHFPSQVSEAVKNKKTGVLSLQPLPSPSVVKTRITLQKWAVICGSNNGSQIPSSDCDAFSKQFPDCHISANKEPHLTFLISSSYDHNHNDSMVFASSLSSNVGESKPSYVSSLTFPRALIVSAGRGCFLGFNTLAVAALSVLHARNAHEAMCASRLKLVHQLKCHLDGSDTLEFSQSKGPNATKPIDHATKPIDHIAAAAAATAAHELNARSPMISNRKSSRLVRNVTTPSTALPPDIMLSPSRQLKFSPIDDSLPNNFVLPDRVTNVQERNPTNFFLVPIRNERDLGEVIIEALLEEHRSIKISVSDSHWVPKCFFPPASLANDRCMVLVAHDASRSLIMGINGSEETITRGFSCVYISDGKRWNKQQRKKAKNKNTTLSFIPVHFSQDHRNMLSDFISSCKKLHDCMRSPLVIESIKKRSIPSDVPPFVSSLHDVQNVQNSHSFHIEDFTFGMHFGSGSQALKLSVHSVSGRSVSYDTRGGITLVSCSEISVDAKDHCIEAVPHVVAMANFWNADPAKSLFAAIKLNATRHYAPTSLSLRHNSFPVARRVSVDDITVSCSRNVTFQSPAQGHTRSHSDPAACFADVAQSQPLMSSGLSDAKHDRSFQLEVGQFSLKLCSPNINSVVCFMSQSFTYLSSDATVRTSLIEFRDVCLKYIISTSIGAYDSPAQEIRIKRVFLQNRRHLAQTSKQLTLTPPALTLCSVECITLDFKSYLFDGGLLVMYLKSWTPPPFDTFNAHVSENFVFESESISCLDLMVDSVSLTLRMSPDDAFPVMPIQFNNCHFSFAETVDKHRFLSLSLPSQRVTLSESGKTNLNAHVPVTSSKRMSLQRPIDSGISGNPFDIDFASVDLHVALSPVHENSRVVEIVCCIGSTHNVLNSDMFNHVLHLFHILSNEMYSIIETMTKQSRIRTVFKQYDSTDVGSVPEKFVPDMLAELGYTVSPHSALQFSRSSSKITFLEFLAISQVFASTGSINPNIALRQNLGTRASEKPQKKQNVFNKLKATIFIKPVHITAVNNAEGGQGALAIFDSGQVFAQISTSMGASPSWCLCFTDLNVQFNRLINLQQSTGQFSLRNLFFFHTKLEFRNQVMPVAFKGNSSSAANFSQTKLFLQPGCQQCISDVVSHFSSAFANFSTTINRDSSGNSQKLRSNMSAAVKSLMEYAKSSAVAFESSMSLSAFVIKFQDIIAFAAYDEAGGKVFGPFNFGSTENTRDLITNRSCLPDAALAFTISNLTLIMLARGKSVDSRRTMESMRQSLQFQGRINSAHFHLFTNQDRATSLPSLDADSFVGLKIHDWALKVLWKFADEHRPSSLDAIFRIPGPLLRLFPETIASISRCLEIWTAIPSSAATPLANHLIGSSIDSRSEPASVVNPSTSSWTRINISVKIDSGQIVLIRQHKPDSESYDTIAGGLKHHLLLKSAGSVQIVEVARLPLPGISVKAAFVVNRNSDAFLSKMRPANPSAKGHRRNLSKDFFPVDASLAKKKGGDIADSTSFLNDNAKSGRHRRKPSSEASFPDIDLERTNVLSITFSAGTIQLTPNILDFLSELRAVMPVKPANRPVQRRNSSGSIRQNAVLTALASDDRVAAAISDQWFVMHIIFDESKLELYGDGNFSEHSVSFIVANSSIIYNAGHSSDSSSSVHFVSLSLEKVQLEYVGKSDSYGVSDSHRILSLSAENVFLNNTTTLDESGDTSVGFFECRRLIIITDFVNPDVYFKANRFLQQWIVPDAEPPTGSANSSPIIRRDATSTRGNGSKTFPPDDASPTAEKVFEPVNFKDRRFFYHFAVRTINIKCFLDNAQNPFLFIPEMSSLGFSVSNPLSQESAGDTCSIYYTLGWSKAITVLSCKIKTEITTDCAYFHLKQPVVQYDEETAAIESRSASLSVALSDMKISVTDLEGEEEICFFDTGVLAIDFATISKDGKILVDMYYSKLLLCMSASSIVSLRKSLDHVMYLINHRLSWRSDDVAASGIGKRRPTIREDSDKDLLPRRKETSAFLDRFSRPVIDMKSQLPEQASQIEIGYLCITGRNGTELHIFGSSLSDSWHASFNSDYFEISLDSNLNSEANEHRFVLEIDESSLNMNQSFHFDPKTRHVDSKKTPLVEIFGTTNLCMLAQPLQSKRSGPESVVCELRTEFSQPICTSTDPHLFKNLQKWVVKAYSSDDAKVKVRLSCFWCLFVV